MKKQTAIELFLSGKFESKQALANHLGIPRSTLIGWIKQHEAKNNPEQVTEKPRSQFTETDLLKDKIKTLESIIRASERDKITEGYIRDNIIGLTKQCNEAAPPLWQVDDTSNDKWESAIPTIFLSDLHWGEVVDPNQIGGVNEYNLEIAHERLKAVVSSTINQLDRINIDYPGIVVALGGDMLSGDIHEELSETNQREMMPVFVDLYEKLAWAIQELHGTFGKVFVPCVTGNHSRTTHKIRAKSRNFTNFDWLLYVMLAKKFEGNNDIVFYIPDGPDALYKIYNTTYLLTHGDQFRGGDGMIGALGPIIRGDHKKRSRNSQVGLDYDCMIIGHWHQLIQMQRLIVNGSLKGYDEYAHANNFGFECPRQALWLTTKQGIGMSMSVSVGDSIAQTNTKSNDSWVSWKV